jgi:cysteine desulfurase
MEFDSLHIQRLSEKLYNKLIKELPQIYLNGDKTKRYPGNLNISFACVEGESMIMAVRNLAVSSG